MLVAPEIGAPLLGCTPLTPARQAIWRAIPRMARTGHRTSRRVTRSPGVIPNNPSTICTVEGSRRMTRTTDAKGNATATTYTPTPRRERPPTPPGGENDHQGLQGQRRESVANDTPPAHRAAVSVTHTPWLRHESRVVVAGGARRFSPEHPAPIHPFPQRLSYRRPAWSSACPAPPPTSKRA